MSNTNTGGPAFPFPAYTYPNGEITHGEGGMTLRDYFAAKAMQGDVSRCGYYGRDELTLRQAENAYKMADAMLKARDAK
jgi:hypothetical protein